MGYIARAFSQEPGALHAMLWRAVRDGLLIRREDGYAFAHDRVQEAAYALVAPQTRPKIHLSIGKALLPACTRTSCWTSWISSIAEHP